MNDKNAEVKRGPWGSDSAPTSHGVLGKLIHLSVP